MVMANKIEKATLKEHDTNHNDLQIRSQLGFSCLKWAAKSVLLLLWVISTL